MNTYVFEEIEKKLSEISFLNLWDECLIIAQELSVNRQIPEGIKLDISIFDEFDEEKDWLTRSENKAFWKELQTWVCGHVIKSIESGEINARYVRRTLEGRIKPEDSFVHRDEIDKWMDSRGLERGEPSIHFEEASEKLCSEMLYTVDSYAECMVDYLHDPYHEWEKSDWTKRQLEETNRYLKRCIDELELSQKASKPINKHKERHAYKREQVLGAAMSVIARYPELCKNKSGNVEATKVRILIEEKAPLFWKSEGEPSLSSDVIERLVRKWLKKTGE